MADPLSIATGVLTILGVVIKTTNTVIRFHRGAQNLHDELCSLERELSSLECSLNDVYYCLASPSAPGAGDIAELEQEFGTAMASIVQTMRNCEASVRQLDACFAKAYPSRPGSGAPWIERGMKGSKLDHMQSELGQLRQQIHTYISAMVLSLSTIGL
jgi:hypothetical protein